MTTTVESSAVAIAKAIFHASKFSTQAVFGLLVGKRLQSHHCFVVDAIPITHTLPAVCPHPVMESALAMVSAFATSKGLVVLGLYVANERLDDNGVSDYTATIVRYLQSKVSGASSGLVLWQLQNPKLKAASSFGGTAPVEQYIYTSSSTAASTLPLSFAQWDGDACKTSPVDDSRVLAAVKNGVLNFEHSKLVDFEDHLENVALDFFNESTVSVSLV
jgi:ER membrane protein complex subunit 8/9